MPPEPPRALLYDWDNTLADGWGGITAALNVTYAAHGLPPITLEQTRAQARRSARESFPAIFGPAWEAASALFYASLRAQHLDHLQPMPAVAALLVAGARLPKGVVSNKDGALLRAEIAHLGWAGHFAAVVGAGDASADKPDAAPLLLALRTMGIPPAPAVWYVGDTALDMQAARAAGCTAILLGDAAHDGGIARAAPDFHFADAKVFADYLLSVA